MATNLVATIMQSLSSEAIGKIASTFGIDQTAAQRGVSAGVPAILASLVKLGSSTDGAQRLSSAVSQVQDLPVSDLVKSALGGDHKSLADMGWSSLSSLLGGGATETLSSAIAQYSGFGQGLSRKLLGFLAPVVLGFLRREQVSLGLDARGLAGLLSSQRENIERALPAGMARRLLDDGARPASQPANTQRRAASIPPRPAQSWAYWLLPAMILAGAAIYLLPSRVEKGAVDEANKTPVAARQTAQVSPAPTLENEIVANIGRLRAALQNVKDPGSAQASLTELKNISDQFDRLKVAARQLTPENRKALAATVASRVPDLNNLIDRVGTDQNLGSVAKPDMDTLKATLVGFSK